MKHWSLLLAFLFFSAAAQASIEKEIAKCAVKPGDLDRLSCYDDFAKQQGLAGPQTQPTKISGKGNWQVSVKTNPVDDSKTVVLALRADSGKSKLGKPVTLITRCKSNTTVFYISWNDYLGRNTEVLTRVGSQDAVTKNWSLSTNSQATFHPRGTISFIKNMMDADNLVAQITPYNESPVTAIFDTSGLENAIKPLRETCNW
jgi:type VI secretion system protein VasI